ncbi:hypothetical protein COO60DRAFT_1552787 [Scenedesmus sp. NREL 46B-D3]|nr:hypothetical protein COO60DRAFT_1552787 [Scenedesmus sp. NREL 46B-D3]
MESSACADCSASCRHCCTAQQREGTVAAKLMHICCHAVIWHVGHVLATQSKSRVGSCCMTGGLGQPCGAMAVGVVLACWFLEFIVLEDTACSCTCCQVWQALARPVADVPALAQPACVWSMCSRLCRHQPMAALLLWLPKQPASALPPQRCVHAACLALLVHGTAAYFYLLAAASSQGCSALVNASTYACTLRPSLAELASNSGPFSLLQFTAWHCFAC